jgi:two-component system sensor histidine kinase PilS (NtrC family)
MTKSINATPEGITPAARRRRQLHWLLFLRVMILSLLLGINILLQSKSELIITPPLTYVAYFIVGVYIFTIFSALLLHYIAWYTTFAYWQLLTDSILVTVLVFFSGGSQSIFGIIYFFPIIAGSFILFRRGGLALAAAATLGYGGVLLLEAMGYQPAFFTNYWFRPLGNIFDAMNYFAVHGVTFFIVALLSALLSERLQRTEKALSLTTREFDRLSLLYEQIFNIIDTGVITLDSRGRITSFNPASTAISGYAAEEVLGRPLTAVFPELAPGGHHPVRPVVALRRKDGVSLEVGYSEASLHVSPDREDSQVITLQDVSEIKKMELQMRQAEKMAAIGEMAAGIAHEFRNPLAAISGSAQMLVQQLTDQPDAHIKGLANIMVRECTRLDGTIADFLQFSKPVVPQKEWLSLTKLIQEVIEMLQQTPEFKADCRIVTNIATVMDCWGDAPQLKRMLINLIHNSLMALPERGGEISIIASEEIDPYQEEQTVLTIVDNGSGIPEKAIDKIFDPFFTTRENGTGLGLAIVSQIVENHDGGISVTSIPGKGSTFRIRLPLPVSGPLTEGVTPEPG